MRALPVFTVSAVLVVAVIVGVTLVLQDERGTGTDDSAGSGTMAVPATGPAEPIASVAPAATPFAVVPDELVDQPPMAVVDPPGLEAEGESAVRSNDASAGASSGDRADIASIGTAAWTNDGFARQLARFQADPLALELLIDAFRSASDPARLERLASLLGEIGHPDLAAIGAQMVSSGDPVSRDAGIALLQQLQPDDPAARETLIGLLAVESDPGVLDAVIDAVSVPGSDAEGQSAALVAQLVPLTRHSSPAVRRNGITVLSRWATDAGVRPILQDALSDTDAGVRASAVYAFAEQPRLDASIRQDLFTVLENERETRGTRSGAMLALQRTELDEEQARRLRAVERELASTL